MLGHLNGVAVPLLTVGDTEGGDYADIQADGSFLLYGDATQWDDLKVPSIATKLGGSKDPTFSKIQDNGAGSQGVFAYLFNQTNEQELYFVVQMPHAWNIGSDIKAHVHWVPDGNGSEGQTVSWGLEYTWSNINATFGATTIIYANDTSSGDTTLLDNKHYLTALGTITGTGKTLSSMLLCRVFRDATGALATDDYGNGAWLLEVDFHFEIDSLGSRQEYIK